MAELLREQEVAELLGMSIHWLQRKRWEGGGIPFVKLPGAVRYRRKDVDEYINCRIRRSTSDPGPKE